jgi:adenosylmethionine-8-amino-7-oxononanoate aminotransferase
VEQAATKGAYLLDSLHAELDGHPHVGNVRGKGMMCGVELVEDKATKAYYPPEWGVGGKMTAALIANKVFTRMRSEVICIAPPLTTDEATLDELVAGVRNAIVSVFGE